ncbi:hypothetical protein OOJ91_08870 [Micromonospora lupini]|uniref:hypothetical protein n=1 Tax=Micromonospora lupini TaxID=285679 RepID=UPI00225438AE|nr:hypothetical protein [Micromonospora lupini]MCX5065994.1 hypothetical protein [Micromonospora lupini]
MAVTKFFVLVAGYDYEGRGSETGLAFGTMCTGRVRERIETINGSVGEPDALVTVDTTLRFLRFSVETGKIEVIDRAFVAGQGVKRTTVAERDWKPLSSVGTGDAFDPAVFASKGPFRAIDVASDYTQLDKKQPRFKQDGTTSGIMSIADVYRSVHNAPDGSVLEVSFFSHGWIEGPILVNSSNLLRDPKLRDTTDKDGRASIDFNVTMGEPADGTVTSISRLFRFMASFDPRGVMRAWGCNFDIEVSLLLQVIKRLKKQKAAVRDDTVIELEFEDKWLARYGVVDPGPAPVFFPADQTVKSFSRTFGDVKRFVRRRLARGYAFKFVESSPMLAGFGALPGTSGDDERSGFFMMRVCERQGKKTGPSNKILECPDGYGLVFRFYKTHLGVEVDRKGYGIFDVTTVQRLNAEITAGTP